MPLSTKTSFIYPRSKPLMCLSGKVGLYCTSLLCLQAVGEPPLILAASVFFAIKEAVAAARTDRGLSQVFRLDSPATVERIRMACQDFLTDKVS